MKYYISKLYDLMLVSILTLAFSSCSGQENEASIEYIPIRQSENGNWSMLSRNGVIICEDEFKNQPSPVTEGVFSVKEGDTYTLYKISGERLVALPGCEGLQQAGIMADGLVPVVFPHERIQILDKNGEKIYELGPIDGQEIVQCNECFSDGLLAVGIFDNELKWGFVDKSGKVIIKPKYASVGDWGDGLCLCATEYDGYIYSSFKVIDREGKELFDIDNEYQVFGGFENGHLLLSSSDHNYVVDTKGKKKKLPSKIDSFSDFDGTYIIFQSQDGEYGVADVNGEICIRPKYSWLSFGLDGKFLAQKAGKDGTFVLDSKGEIVSDLDYEIENKIYDFGYEAKEGKRYVILGEDLKPMCEDEFYAIGYSLRSNLESDYFDPASVANQLADLLRKDGFGEYTYGNTGGYSLYGTGMRMVLPEKYMSSPIVLAENQGGYRYTYKIIGFFTESISHWDGGKYQWNEDAELERIRLILTAPEEYSEEIFRLLVDTLKSKNLYEVSCEESADGRLSKVWLSWTNQSTYADLVIVYDHDCSILLEMQAAKNTEDVVDQENSLEGGSSK